MTEPDPSAGSPDDQDERDPFFVGYLPMPPRLVRFTMGVALVAWVSIGLLAAGLARTQRSPGPTLEKSRYGVSLSGLWLDLGYPVLRHVADGQVRHALLVRGGKTGVPDRPDLVGKQVEAKGLLLERDGRQLLELYGVKEASSPIDIPDEAKEEVAPTQAEPKPELSFRGRIVDSKCYYGRMRPGHGRTHRACAQYCIESGIPPVLITNEETTNPTHYVLLGPSRRRIHHEVLSYVDEAVELTGQIETNGDFQVLIIDPTSLTRLPWPKGAW